MTEAQLLAAHHAHVSRTQRCPLCDEVPVTITRDQWVAALAVIELARNYARSGMDHALSEAVAQFDSARGLTPREVRAEEFLQETLDKMDSASGQGEAMTRRVHRVMHKEGRCDCGAPEADRGG